VVGVIAGTVAVGMTGGGKQSNFPTSGYEVAFEVEIPKRGHGTYPQHFKAANEALLRAMADPDLAAALKSQLGADFESTILSPSGGVRGNSPGDWTWHHVPGRPGFLQLVRRAHHESKEMKKLFHPNGGSGGMKEWGADY